MSKEMIINDLVIEKYIGKDKHVKIPYGVREIAQSAFYLCDSIESIDISDSVVNISDWAFGYCVNLKEIKLPKNVEFISESAFDCCSSLRAIEVSEKNKYYKSIDGILFSKDVNVLVRFPIKHCSDIYEISGKVKRIAKNAFNRVDSLKEVIISNNITIIDDKAFAFCSRLKNILLPKSINNLGYCTFANCLSILSYDIEKENQSFKTLDGGILFSKDEKRIIQYPLGKCDTTYLIPRKVEKINDRAFSCSKFIENFDIDNNNVSVQ